MDLKDMVEVCEHGIPHGAECTACLAKSSLLLDVDKEPNCGKVFIYAKRTFICTLAPEHNGQHQDHMRWDDGSCQ